MGSPLNRSTSQVRENPVGIPYLYLASAPNTAVSEMARHTGVVYNRSVGDGINLAIFNPATAEPVEEVGYQVTRFSVDVET